MGGRAARSRGCRAAADRGPDRPRRSRGSVAVASRCRYGLPVVVRTAPLLPDGTPFPTLYWLACPAARVAVGRLEAAGWSAELSERVAAEPELAAAHAAAHTQLPGPGSHGPLPGNPGVGGLPGGVKCLRPLRPPVRHRRQPGRPHRQPGRRPHRLPGSLRQPPPGGERGRSLGGEDRLSTAGTETVRLAALDVGTNSTRLLVADVAGGAIVAEHAREMVITRLGKGVDRTGHFDPVALARTLEVLAGYAATLPGDSAWSAAVWWPPVPPGTPPTGRCSSTASATCSASNPRC